MDPVTFKVKFNLQDLLAILDVARSVPGLLTSGEPISLGTIVDLINRAAQNGQPKRRSRRPGRKPKVEAPPAAGAEAPPVKRGRGRPRKVTPDAASTPADYKS